MEEHSTLNNINSSSIEETKSAILEEITPSEREEISLQVSKPVPVCIGVLSAKTCFSGYSESQDIESKSFSDVFPISRDATAHDSEKTYTDTRITPSSNIADALPDLKIKCKCAEDVVNCLDKYADLIKTPILGEYLPTFDISYVAVTSQLEERGWKLDILTRTMHKSETKATPNPLPEIIRVAAT